MSGVLLAQFKVAIKGLKQVLYTIAHNAAGWQASLPSRETLIGYVKAQCIERIETRRISAPHGDRMKRLITSLIAALVLSAQPMLAGDRPVVVELYTSQGCSSCPPADALLHDLAARDDVVALAMHVDYWDYIGWKDSFAHPNNAKRQRAYAQRSGRKMVYTPQMIINGSDHVVGNRPMDVADLIDRHRKADKTVNLTLVRSGGKVTIAAEPVPSAQGPLTVQLLRYRPKSTVAIKRGENAGRTLSYANVVTELKVLGHWNAAKPLRLSAPLTGDQPAVVLVQHAGPGPVVAVGLID